MSASHARLVAAAVFSLAGVTPGFAQMIGPAESAHFWVLLLPNAAVALLGLGWVALMARRRG
jgi:hypothetical protein